LKDAFEPFPCGECGATVVKASAAGKVWEFRRGVPVAIPEHVIVPRCPRCGDMYLDDSDVQAIETAVRAVVLKEQVAVYERCVAKLQTEHDATLGEIERVCGVTPTYLSHVMKGRRVASVTLTRLLEALAASSNELRRHLTAIRLAAEEPVRPTIAGKGGSFPFKDTRPNPKRRLVLAYAHPGNGGGALAA
jgi:hypothetical protein